MARIPIYILTACLLTPATISAQEPETVVAVGEVWLVENELFFSVETEHLLDEDARETIREGGTAAIDYTFKLYRHRRGWFDSLIESRYQQFRISFDAFERQYRVISPDLRLKSEDFETVTSQCTHLEGVSFGTTEDLRLDPQVTYYIVVRVRYQPMSVETIDDLRDWVSGSDRNEETGSENRREGLGSRVARVLMSAAGFGEEDLQGESGHFTPDGLETRVPPGDDR